MTTPSKLAAVVCGIGLGLCAWAAAAQAPAPNAASRRATMPVEGVMITNPEWARLPDGEVLSNYYPKLAQMLELRGAAKMTCKVTAAGALEACVIDEETPAGLGFGDATLATAQFFRMKPMTVDGVPVAGGKVVIPMNWEMPDTVLPPDPNADQPPPAPAALALGRRLVAAMGGSAPAAAFYRAQATDRMGSATSTPAGQAAFAAFDRAADAAAEGYGETMATAYARTFSIAELEGLVTFFESPAGHAWRAHQQLQEVAQYAGQKAWQQMAADARREVCAKTTCLPTPAAAASTPSKPAETDQRAKP